LHEEFWDIYKAHQPLLYFPFVLYICTSNMFSPLFVPMSFYHCQVDGQIHVCVFLYDWIDFIKYKEIKSWHMKLLESIFFNLAKNKIESVFWKLLEMLQGDGNWSFFAFVKLTAIQCE
jgi:hypothetical protein